MKKEERYLTVDQVAAMLKHHRNTIVAWIQSGRLPASKPGGRYYRIALSDVEHLIKVQQIQVRREPEICI